MLARQDGVLSCNFAPFAEKSRFFGWCHVDDLSIYPLLSSNMAGSGEKHMDFDVFLAAHLRFLFGDFPASHLDLGTKIASL